MKNKNQKGITLVALVITIIVLLILAGVAINMAINEDLVFFSYDVRQGNTYAEKTVKLGTNLDFNSSKSYVDPYRKDYGKYGYNGELKTLLISGEGFIPIGTTSNLEVVPYSFAGTFDGQGNKIINLYMNKTTVPDKEMRIGLFGNNKGTIKNVGIINGEITLTMNGKTGDVGGIAGKNYNTIENCYYTGNSSIYAEDTVTGMSRIGGIVSGNDGTLIKNCYHIGKINVKNESTSQAFAGGIAAGNSVEISGCYSKGSIAVESQKASAAGICAANNANGIINNCYNTKSISNTAESVISGLVVGTTGGIVANMAKNTSVYNCYNLGEIVSQSTYNGSIIGCIQGGLATSEAPQVENCYYLSGTATKGIGATREFNYTTPEKTKTEMQSEGIITLLNTNNAGAWKADTNKINDGYPILSWQ